MLLLIDVSMNVYYLAKKAFVVTRSLPLCGAGVSGHGDGGDQVSRLGNSTKLYGVTWETHNNPK